MFLISFTVEHTQIDADDANEQPTTSLTAAPPPPKRPRLVTPFLSTIKPTRSPPTGLVKLIEEYECYLNEDQVVSSKDS